MFLENAERGKYKVHLDPGFNGADSELQFNFAYTLDPEIQKWFANVDFRRALALGIDRDQINQAFFLGLGVTGHADPGRHDPAKPRQGVAQQVGDARRQARPTPCWTRSASTRRTPRAIALRTDNGQRLRLQIDVAQTLTPSWPQQAEMIIQQWRAIGIAGDMRLLERSLFYTRVRNDQNQMVLFSNNGSESLYLYTVPVLPMDPQSSFGGAANAQWYASNGASGIEPTDPALLKGFELLRGAVGQNEEQRTEPQGAVEDAGRPGLVDRAGRPVAGLHGHPRGQPAAGERARAHLHLAALPHAVERPSGAVVLQVDLPSPVFGQGYRMYQVAAELCLPPSAGEGGA